MIRSNNDIGSIYTLHRVKAVVPHSTIAMVGDELCQLGKFIKTTEILSALWLLRGKLTLASFAIARRILNVKKR